jgi:hypothetical protein
MGARRGGLCGIMRIRKVSMLAVVIFVHIAPDIGELPSLNIDLSCILEERHVGLEIVMVRR